MSPSKSPMLSKDKWKNVNKLGKSLVSVSLSQQLVCDIDQVKAYVWVPQLLAAK